jgi:hypothetical protein
VPKTYEQMLGEDMARFFADPLGFVMYAYPWDTDPTIQVCKLLPPYDLLYGDGFGPDKWACDFLTKLGEDVRKRGFDALSPTPVEPIRKGIASGHGIGKSAMMGWLVGWITSTRPLSQGTVTAATAPQLETKTWAQIIKWMDRCITRHWWDITTGRGQMAIRHKQRPREWFCTAQTCRKENSQAFAGQHAVNSTSYYLIDEASGVPDEIHIVSEGGLTDGEPMKIAFGNPTENSGWFADIFQGQISKRWDTLHIDSRDVAITNKVEINNWIDDYGIDSDFVKVRVRGVFPSQSARQFISIADVDAAFGRQLRLEQYNFAPRILSVDPAWEGDDEMVIGLRQGLKFDILRVIPKNDNDIQVAGLIAQLEDEHQADAVIIDGGHGTGIVSAGRTWGRAWHIVWFGSASAKPGYLNKRAEMWGDVKDWLKAGGAIPDDHKLRSHLITPEVVGRADGIIQLEAKRDLKKRLLASPDRADALAISFAFPVVKKPRGIFLPVHERGAPHAAQREYDPYANLT